MGVTAKRADFAYDNTGNPVITWSAHNPGSNSWDVYLQQVTSTGSLQGSAQLRLEVGDGVQGGISQIIGLIAQCRERLETTPAQEGSGAEPTVLWIHAGAGGVTHGMLSQQHKLRGDGCPTGQSRVLQSC